MQYSFWKICFSQINKISTYYHSSWFIGQSESNLFKLTKSNILNNSVCMRKSSYKIVSCEYTLWHEITNKTYKYYTAFKTFFFWRKYLYIFFFKEILLVLKITYQHPMIQKKGGGEINCYNLDKKFNCLPKVINKYAGNHLDGTLINPELLIHGLFNMWTIVTHMT